MVIASCLLDKAYEKGYAQGYAEGYAKGRAKAYADVNRQMDAYFRRMRAVLAAGEDFNEPRPRFGKHAR